MSRDEWRPIGEAILENHQAMIRPHVIHGPMSVVYFDVRSSFPFKWFSTGMCNAWPDDAFAPFWMPLPFMPEEWLVKAKLDTMDSIDEFDHA